MASAWPLATAEELVELEADVQRALDERAADQLAFVGFGDLSVALALGTDRVAKRMPAFTPAGFDNYRELIERYLADLRSVGITVVDTEVHGVPRADGTVLAYLVQPLLSPESLGEQVLRAALEPTEDHPLLLAIGEAVLGGVSEKVSVDAQVTNWWFSPDGTEAELALLDVGTPMVWSADGAPALDMDPFLAMVPWPARWPMKKVMTDVMDRWKGPEGVLTDAVANLYREGLDDWVEVAAITWGRQLGATLDRKAAEKAWKEDQRLWPFVTRLKLIERWWRTRRAEPYDFFIQTTYGSAGIR